MNALRTELRDPVELIRVLMLLDDYHHTHTLRSDQTQLRLGATTYALSPHVILDLIDSGWLTSIGKSDGYQFDYDREDEWLAEEKVRLDRARSILVEKYPTKTFHETGSWTIFHHPESIDQDTRGIVFSDDARYKYLVCEAGRVLHIPRDEITNAHER